MRVREEGGLTKRREEEGIFFTPCLSGEGWWVIRSCFEGLWNVAKKNLFSDDVKKGRGYDGVKKEKKKKNPSLMKDLKIKRKEDKVLSSGPRPARTHPLTRSVKNAALLAPSSSVRARGGKKETHEIVDRRGHKKRASIVFEQVNI